MPSDEKAISVAEYSVADEKKPVAESKIRFFDVGKIKIADIQEKSFEVKNIGEKPLQLFNVTSSCGCTTGQIIYQGKTSREFGMHAPQNEVFSILPQTKAVIKLTYRPFAMPVYGVVTREVYVSTNDPQNQKLVFQIKADVE